MKNLIIDIGNTRIKGGLFIEGQLIRELVWDDLKEVEDFHDREAPDHVLISSVKENQVALQEILGFSFMYFDKSTPLPITNKYSTPQTLGTDRLAGVIGGLYHVAEGPILAIDLGTCITYDLLTDQNEYLGGAISPGLQMRARAMSEQTKNLPKVEVKSAVAALGDSTVTSLQSGIFYGVKGEIAEFISQYSQDHPNLKVFLCGGDANFFERLTKDHIFVIPNLVLHGLNRILTYNVDKN